MWACSAFRGYSGEDVQDKFSTLTKNVSYVHSRGNINTVLAIDI